MSRRDFKDEFSVAWFLAIKNIMHKKIMLFMIIVIIGMGFLSTIFSGSIINGLQYEIEEKAINGLAGHVVIEPNEGDMFIENVKQIEKKILAIPHVYSVSPSLTTVITMTDKFGTKITTQAFVINPEKLALTSTIEENIVSGSYLSNAAVNEIIIGGGLTKKHRTLEGDTAIDVESGDKIEVDFGSGIIKDMKIKGVYMFNLMVSDKFVYISEKDLIETLGIEKPDYASRIVIRADDRGYEEFIVNKLVELGVNAKVVSWEEKLGILEQFTGSLMIISGITGIIGIIIAFATIYIMVYINVIQKRSQIGILKAVGITGDTILVSYIIQSFIYGFLGTIVGIIMTLGFIQYFTANPIIMPMGDIRPYTVVSDFVKSGLILLIGAIVAGFLASRGVVKENILDAIFKG